MNYPKIKSVTAEEDSQLLVVFDNGAAKLYDCKPLLATDVFEPLRQDWFFRLVKPDVGGYGVIWDENLDLSESELWENGREVELHP
ncbi:MAG TPA: DUF2442 domain-containing protein, partial [bacterium]|nr:DUF2442 domain-containing protein [bacterium]